MKILADASLPHLKSLFPSPFTLLEYRNLEELKATLNHAEGLICRSTLRVDKPLLTHAKLKFVATASSGIDHIDEFYLQDNHITLLDAKGCNARSVADYVISSLAWLERFTSFKAKKIGIIGYGAVGSKVAHCLQSLGYTVDVFDPYKFPESTLDQLASCNLLCVHPNLHDQEPYPSRNLINGQFLSQLKNNTAIINASRGGIVNEDDLLKCKTTLYYCTDVYLNEPDINPAIIEFSTLCTPHIAGHSIEAKQNAVMILSQKIHKLLKLPQPSFSCAAAQHSLVDSNPELSWQERRLTFYNPHEETLYLKSKINKHAAFLSLRKSHNFRHDSSE